MSIMEDAQTEGSSPPLIVLPCLAVALTRNPLELDGVGLLLLGPTRLLSGS